MVQPEVSLTSNLTDGVAYENDTVIFNCTIQGAEDNIIISWSGNEYVGPGNNVIEFASVDNPEETIPRQSSTHPTTIATLISVTTDNTTGVTVIVSQLHIRASVQYPNSSISCRLDGHGAVSTITFTTSQYR